MSEGKRKQDTRPEHIPTVDELHEMLDTDRTWEQEWRAVREESGE